MILRRSQRPSRLKPKEPPNEAEVVDVSRSGALLPTAAFRFVFLKT